MACLAREGRSYCLPRAWESEKARVLLTGGGISNSRAFLRKTPASSLEGINVAEDREVKGGVLVWIATQTCLIPG